MMFVNPLAVRDVGVIFEHISLHDILVIICMPYDLLVNCPQWFGVGSHQVIIYMI